MAHCSRKKTCNILDPLPAASLAESSAHFWLQHPPCSSAQVHLQKNCPCQKIFESYPPKHWPIACLNFQIQTLLHCKLIHHISNRGRPTDTLEMHYHDVLKEMHEWFHLPEKGINSIKSNLLTYLCEASCKVLKEMPSDFQEWSRLLIHWSRKNMTGELIKHSKIYSLLAVDGFYGFQAKDLKKYLPNVLMPLRREYQIHVEAVRELYKWINENEKVSSLTGTDCACIVFMTLLRFFKKNLQLNDHQTLMDMRQTEMWAEGFLNQHVNYYKHIRNVNDEMLDDLGRVYKSCFGYQQDWKCVGQELSNNLSSHD